MPRGAAYYKIGYISVSNSDSAYASLFHVAALSAVIWSAVSLEIYAAKWKPLYVFTRQEWKE